MLKKKKVKAKYISKKNVLKAETQLSSTWREQNQGSGVVVGFCQTFITIP